MCDLVKTKINELGNFFLSKVKKKVAVWWQFGGSLVAVWWQFAGSLMVVLWQFDVHTKI